MVNPLKTYESLKELEDAVGFTVTLPEKFEPVTFISINKLLEVRDKNGVTLRKAIYDEKNDTESGISGVYTGGYPGDCLLSFFETDCAFIRENEKGSYLAIFNRDIDESGSYDFSYSIFAKDGIDYGLMREYINNFI